MGKEIPQSRADLEAHLAEQLAYLRNSASLYDAGHSHEAKRLAVPIRVLLHDTKHSRSLLGQLGLLDLAFCDTAGTHNPANLLTHHGLAALHIANGGARYQAMLDDSPRGQGLAVPFDYWWNKVVIVDSDRLTLTRRDLVLAVSNQDGGAHVDPALDETYAKLSRSNSLGWAYTSGERSVPLDSPVPASLRQIAHELIKTLADPRKLRDVPLASPTPTRGSTTPSRNQPCTCGSGKKYKYCCGRASA